MRSRGVLGICGLVMALATVFAAPGARASVDRPAHALPTASDLPGATAIPVSASAWFARLSKQQRKRSVGKPAGVRLTVSGASVVGFAAVLRDKTTAKSAAAALTAASRVGDAVAVAGLGATAGTPVTRSVFAAGTAVVEVAGTAGSSVLPGVVAQVKARVTALAAQSRWQALQAQSPARSTRSSRLKDFALAFGPVPGVKVDRSGLGAIEDGTSALAAIRADLKHLTVRQRAAVNAILKAPSRAPRKARKGKAHKASSGARARAAVIAPTAQLRRIAAEAEAHFAKELALKPTFTLDVAPAVIGYKVAGSNGHGANAWEYPGDAAGGTAGPIKVCHIRFNFLLNYRGTDLEQTVAHEVFHCFQDQILGSGAAIAQRVAGANWLMEGGAEWAACTFAGGKNGRDWFAYWAATPDQILYGRTYDAIGAFSELRKSTGVDPFTTMAAALKQANQVAAFGALAGGRQEQFLDNLGPSFLQQPTRFTAGDWDQQGECKDGPPPEPSPLVLGMDVPQSVSVPALAARLLSPQPQAGARVLTVTATAGRVRVSGSNATTGQPTDDLLSPDGTASRDYCMDGTGCACPGADPLPELDPNASRTPVITVAGDTLKGGVGVVARKLVCPVITSAEFKVDGATFNADEGTAQDPRSWNVQLHWDDTFSGNMPLNVNRSLCACAAGTHGGGTFTANVGGHVCQGTVSLEDANAPKDGRLSVLASSGGRARTWTLLAEATASGYPGTSGAGNCLPPDFGGFDAATLFEGTVTLTATGSQIVKTQSFPISSNPAHGYEHWTGTLTLTGIW